MIDFSNCEKLTKEFYRQNVLTVAREILGKIIIKKSSDHFLAGKIVEVEAYGGDEDESSHSFNGKTERNKVMFNVGGSLYVYFTYGMHFCSNIVTGEEGKGFAVLIRGVEPLYGIDNMVFNRFKKEIATAKEIINLTNGPAKFSSAFNIKRSENGTDLTGNYIYIVDNKGISSVNIIASKRIGINRATDLPWRFYIKDNLYVSK